MTLDVSPPPKRCVSIVLDRASLFWRRLQSGGSCHPGGEGVLPSHPTRHVDMCVRFIGKIMHDPSCLLLYLSLTFRQTNCRCPKSSLHTRRHTHFTRTHSHATDNKSHTFTKLTPANIDPARMYALTHENSGSKCRWQYTAHASDYIVLCFYGKPIFFVNDIRAKAREIGGSSNVFVYTHSER